MLACVVIPNEMQIPSMNKSTKVISLVLMGSALALAGCSSRTDDEEEDRVGGGGGHGGYGGARVIAPGFRGGWEVAYPSAREPRPAAASAGSVGSAAAS